MNALLRTCLAAVLFGVAVVASASPTIELKDGSRIQGDIQGLENGVYAVKSASLGVVHVAQSDIARIVYGGGAAAEKPQTRNDDIARNVLQLQSSLAQDPDMMKSIASLQDDPQIQAILNDPAIIQAIQNGDYTSLLDNPKIKALENNSRMKEILQQQGR